MRRSEFEQLFFGPEPELQSFDVSNEDERWQFLWRLSELGEPGLIAATTHVWESLAAPRKTRCILMAAAAKVGGVGKVGLHAVLARFLVDFETDCRPPDLPAKGDFANAEEWHAAVSAHFGHGMLQADKVITRYSKILNGENPDLPEPPAGVVILGPWRTVQSRKMRRGMIRHDEAARRIDRLVSMLHAVIDGVYDAEYVFDRRLPDAEFKVAGQWHNLMTLAVEDGWTGRGSLQMPGVPGDLAVYFETLFRAEIMSRGAASPILSDIHRGVLQSKVVWLRPDLREAYPFNWDGSLPAARAASGADHGKESASSSTPQKLRLGNKSRALRSVKGSDAITRNDTPSGNPRSAQFIAKP